MSTSIFFLSFSSWAILCSSSSSFFLYSSSLLCSMISFSFLLFSSSIISFSSTSFCSLFFFISSNNSSFIFEYKNCFIYSIFSGSCLITTISGLCSDSNKFNSRLSDSPWASNSLSFSLFLLCSGDILSSISFLSSCFWALYKIFPTFFPFFPLNS